MQQTTISLFQSKVIVTLFESKRPNHALFYSYEHDKTFVSDGFREAWKEAWEEIDADNHYDGARFTLEDGTFLKEITLC